MKRLIFKIIVACLAAMGIIALAAGCSSNNSQSSNTTSTSSSNSTGTVNIQSIADPIINNIMVSLKNDDYAGFSKDFSQNVKSAINEVTFNQLYNQMQSKVGEFQSVIFVGSTSQSNNVNIIIYVAHYSNEPAGVTVTLSLQDVNGSYQVQGLNFNSPILAGQSLDVNQIRSYADTETENILTSLTNNDYSGFSKNLNTAMKNAVSVLTFNNMYKKQKSAVGDYQNSLEFESATMQNNIVTIRYLAKYSEEPAGVWVTISFDSNQEIAGLYFSSPKLAAAQ